jgi:hypothetical protein
MNGVSFESSKNEQNENLVRLILLFGSSPVFIPLPYIYPHHTYT